MFLARVAFELTHVYSKSATAPKKRAIDMAIMGGTYANGGKIRLDDGAYLKALIGASAHDRGKLIGSGRGVQFFIIRGGAEGFFDASYSGKDAGRIIEAAIDTRGRNSNVIFDDNDLICAFDGGGTFIGAAPLRRPLSIPGLWTEHTANRVYNAWNGQRVSMYRNTNFLIPYYGLVVYDSLGLYQSGAVRVDLHKEEQTNGCIFIRDPATPQLTSEAALGLFEPAFIRNVQASVGASIKSNIGTMHMLWIK